MHRRYLRPGWIVGHALVLVAVLVCLRLGWWQWNRTHEANGTVQNLGYAVLWPCFGAAFIYMWIRFLKLEIIKEAEDEALIESELGSIDVDTGSGLRAPVADPVVIAAAPAVPDVDIDEATPKESEGRPEPDPDRDDPRPRTGRASSPWRAVTLAVASVGGEDDEDDPELNSYNRALAALAEKDRRRGR